MRHPKTASPSREYSPAVAQLFALGHPGGPDGDSRNWRDVPVADYAALGITPAHAPELIALAMDRSAVDGPEPFFWGPVHATRALISLRITDAIPALINAIRLGCKTDFDFWVEDLGGEQGLALLGPAAIDPICKVARDQREDFGTRIYLFAVLEHLAKLPEHSAIARPRVIAFLRELLRLASYNEPQLNSSIISALVELGAVESLPEIRAAFDTVNRPGRTRSGMGGVDEFGCGDLEEMEKRINMSPADRLRESIGWAEKHIVEIKEMIASGERSVQDGNEHESDDEDDEEDLGGILFDEHDLKPQEETLTLENLRAELARLESGSTEHSGRALSP